jgi:monoamine oxidase
MPKAPAFRLLQKALKRALFLSRHPHLQGALEDFEASKLDAPTQDRREFLKSSAALGLAAMPLSALLANCATARAGQGKDLSRSISSDEPVIIIGGGLAGLTAAYHLMKAGVPCEIHEALTRVGGRVYTQDRFNADGMFCELGGELIDSTHTELIQLARELGLELDDFRPFDADVKKHQFFIGGKRYFDSDLAAACQSLAARIREDFDKAFPSPDFKITYRTFTPEAQRLDRMSITEYLDGVAGIAPWARKAIDIAYLTEFGMEPERQSALNLVMLAVPEPGAGFGIYGPSDESMRIRGGNSRVPEALSRALEGKVPVHYRSRLARIAESSGGDKIQLVFEQSSHGGRGGRSLSVRASRVICAIPFSVLRGVEGVSKLALSPVKRKCIAELGYGANTKHMLGFSARHWRKPQAGIPATNGYTITDLPSQTQWESSRMQKGERGIMTTFLGGAAADDGGRGTVESILSDLEVICPGTRALYDRSGAIFRWGRNPFAMGSYACPSVGQYTTIVGSAGEAELGGKLLFAGEHASANYQGYMNGAVESGIVAASAIVKARGARPTRRRKAAREIVPVPAGVEAPT